MQNGWISLHRRLVNHEIYPDPFLLKLWIHCLFKASHTEREQLVGRQIVTISPGQFVTGRDALAAEFNKGAKKDLIVSSRTLWRWMKTFEQLQMLSIKSETKFSVVTIINWSSYQNNDQQVSNKCPTNDQQVSTNNNVNNENKKDMFIQQAEREFDLWWDLYAKKRGKAKCRVKFKALLKKYEYSVIEEGTKRYLDYLQRNNIAKQYKKDPITFLNGEHFTDEYEDAHTGNQAVNAGSPVNELILNMDED